MTGLDVWEKRNESAGISEENLPELQDRKAQAGSFCHLYRQKAQATSGLSGIQSNNRLLPAHLIRYNAPFTRAAR